MTDFFKNNPIALRHCLLYEYLRKNQFDRSLVALQKTFGPDIIKKKKFHFWFNQFKQGVFDMNQDKKPIAGMRNVLQSDKNALRACILYESLKYKLADRESAINALWPYSKLTLNEIRSNPSFAMYKMFCKAVGKDVMEYQEFDFWFYRFLNGEHELNYERNEDKKTYELSDMPIDVMENVVEYLDIFERINLTKTSRSLQRFIEDQKLFHHTLKLRIYDSVAIVSLSESVNIEYIRDSVGCKRIFKDPNRRPRRVDHWKQALLDFKSIIKNPKLHLDTLDIGLSISVKQALNDLEDALKFTHLLNVKKLIIEEYSWNTLATILPTLKPGYLTAIDIGSPDENSMQIVIEMEQWKRAKRVHMNGDLFLWSLYHLNHFEEFHIRLLKLSVENFRQMKEFLSKSPNFEWCSVTLDSYHHTGAEVIEEELGDYIQQGQNIPEYMKFYHYPIPNSTEYFEIYVEESYFEISKNKI